MIDRQNSADFMMVVEDYEGIMACERPIVRSPCVAETGVVTVDIADFPPEDHVVAATLEALEQHGSLTPLIKNELKTKIQTRRIREGQEELKVEFNHPKAKTLTEEESKRAIMRRDQNRIAAQRFRLRQKDTAHHLLKKTEKLESSNTALRVSLASLRREKEELEGLLRNHLLLCHDPQTGQG